MFKITEPVRNRFHVVAADRGAYDQLLSDVACLGPNEPNAETLTRNVPPVQPVSYTHLTLPTNREV